ncbi:MAG: hypothetical protein CTY19_10610 [Methylomonas sp.]|nr:MAG: hypothetical protein CTY19_10610 [Methylomonas sp.]
MKKGGGMNHLTKTILLTMGALTSSGAYAANCAVTEVYLGGFSATACSGYGASGNPTAELNNLNAITAFNSPIYGTDIFQQVFRTNDTQNPGDADDSGSFNALGSSLNLSITDMGIDAGLNTFTLSWSDPDTINAPNLPYYIDLVFSFKAGNVNSDAGIAYFFFDNFLLTNNPFSTDGEYNLIVDKKLSHNGLYARAGKQPDSQIPGLPVPEPSSVALLGIGLLGFAAQQLRKKQQ